MKRLLLINETINGSHGKICVRIAQEYEKKGYEVKIAFGRNDIIPESVKKYAIRIGSMFDVRLHVFYTRMTDKTGFASKKSTKRFIDWLSKYNPTEIWLHNLHGYYINIEMLFNWIKQHNDGLIVKWTLHDCWAFTGHCSHFSFVRCYKWKTQCSHCPQRKRYPKTFIDNSKWNYEKKKRVFCGLKNCEIIVPSFWLQNLVKQSFLNIYKITVMPNPIDTTIFKPTNSNLKNLYSIDNKTILLSVASVWNDRKGLYDLVELSKKISDRYVMIIVGLNRKQKKLFSNSVIKIEKTNDQLELVKLYSVADYLINPSYEETFGMTVAEAQLCGCRTIIYKDTASMEILDSNLGVSVSPGAINIYQKLEEIQKNEDSIHLG